MARLDRGTHSPYSDCPPPKARTRAFGLGQTAVSDRSPAAAERVRLVRPLPGEVPVVAAEVTVGGRLRVDRADEVEVADDRPGAEVEVLADELLEGRDGHRLGPEALDVHAHRVRDSDRVGDLDLTAVGETRGDDVLRHVPRRVRGRAVDLRRVLAGEGAAPVRRRAAVRVDDDLPPREAGVPHRPPDDELARRVDVEEVLRAELRGIEEPAEVRLQDRLDDLLDVESLMKPDLLEQVVEPILQADFRGLFDPAKLGAKDFFYVNPTGKFVIGGPMGDTGLTGRKIVVDTYGGAAPHGGGAFSGKDPTKVDRSAAYAARYVAKNVVAAGLADRCQIQVAYAIGVAHPMSVNVECFGTESVPIATLEELVGEHFDLRPGAIIRDLDLVRPIYAKTAAYGHFGRDDRDFTWERTDKADALRAAAGLLSETAV